MAWPNVLVMTAQSSTGLIETWWVSHLGTDALAGMALVFPGFMMMQMLSAGAIGGGISSAVARALGGGRRDDADALVLHAVLVNSALGLAISALFLVFGRPIYAAMGGQGASLEAALAYSNVVFMGNVLVWLLNALASVIRGTGNMLVPSLAVCLGILCWCRFHHSSSSARDLSAVSASRAARRSPTDNCAVRRPLVGICGPGTRGSTGASAASQVLFTDILRVGASARSIRSKPRRCSPWRPRWSERRRARRRRGIWYRRPARIPADPAGIRVRRTHGRAGGDQHRRRPTSSGRFESL